MSQFKKNRFFLYLTLAAALVFVLVPSFETNLQGSQAASLMRISHTPMNYFISGSRIQVKALVSDEAGVMLVRCYFKAKWESEYVFVDMPLMVGNEYIGIIPAPSEGTSALEYILLAVNQNGLVVRSQVFEAKQDTSRELPVWQDVSMSGSIAVNTEMARAPRSLPGFADNITADVVESVFRFGYVVEGIYLLSQMVGAAPVGAVSGGTVSATTTRATPRTSKPTPSVTKPSVVTSRTTTQQPAPKKKGISPLIIIGGAALVAGGVLLATGVLGAKKLSVRITVADAGTLDDTFEVYLDGELLGTTSFGGSGSWTRDLKEKSSHTLKVTNLSGGTYCTINITNTNAAAQDQPWLDSGASYTKTFLVDEKT